MNSARIPYTLPSGHEESDVPTFWLLLYGLAAHIRFAVVWGFRNSGFTGFGVNGIFGAQGVGSSLGLGADA